MPEALKVSILTARQFARRALLLDDPVCDAQQVVGHLGYVQIDPINICGRMHDHILRNRVSGYREGDLGRHLYGGEARLKPEDRVAFEHHLPDSHVLVAFSLEAWPHLQAAMARRAYAKGAWSGKLTAAEQKLAGRALKEIGERGPLSPEQLGDGRRSRASVWGSSTLAKSTLQKLFFHGRLLISGRRQNRRIYDLPEKILPARILALSEAKPAETQRWLAWLRLRQRRLVTLKRSERAAVEDLIQPVEVPGGPELFCLKSDLPLFENPVPAPAKPLLLAPLDPLIYDRRLTLRLWDFDYIWEAYTPAAKRRRGYYALPILSGTELAGHVDLKADRANRRLTIVSKRAARGTRAAGPVKELARFLGLGRPGL